MERCYVCRECLGVSHASYPRMCPDCGAKNLEQRERVVDLSGRTALITGGRVKIGYQTALRMLRCGATVVATSRFPHSTLARYQQEPDHDHWADRLHVYGLDLLRIDLLRSFVERIYQSFDSLDILVNNAAQTVKDEEDVRQQLELEQRHARRELTGASIVHELPHPPTDKQVVVAGSIVLDDEQTNAWMMRSGDVTIKELLETQIINVTGPFLLSTALRSLLEASPHTNRFLINVSSMEGKFDIKDKSPAHPHTNMAKAALNMMTKTFAREFRRSGISVYSVDPGWVSNQYPGERPTRRQLPLTLEDAAARITHPVFTWKDVHKPPTGLFLKDYEPTAW